MFLLTILSLHTCSWTLWDQFFLLIWWHSYKSILLFHEMVNFMNINSPRSSTCGSWREHFVIFICKKHHRSKINRLMRVNQRNQDVLHLFRFAAYFWIQLLLCYIYTLKTTKGPSVICIDLVVCGLDMGRKNVYLSMIKCQLSGFR